MHKATQKIIGGENITCRQNYVIDGVKLSLKQREDIKHACCMRKELENIQAQMIMQIVEVDAKRFNVGKKIRHTFILDEKKGTGLGTLGQPLDRSGFRLFVKFGTLWFHIPPFHKTTTELSIIPSG